MGLPGRERGSGGNWGVREKAPPVNPCFPWFVLLGPEPVALCTLCSVLRVICIDGPLCFLREVIFTRLYNRVVQRSEPSRVNAFIIPFPHPAFLK